MEGYLHQAPCLFFCCREDGIITDVNDTLCTRLGYAREELLGKKVEILFTLATRIFQQTHLFPLLKIQGYAEEIFITLQSKDRGQVPVLLNAEKKETEGQAIYVHAGIIVQNRKKFEDELIAAKKAAEAALNENTALVQAKKDLQKHMEELDRQVNLVKRQNDELKQFNRVVTHDLQEPLRKLSLFATMLNSDLEGRSRVDTLGKLGIVAQQMRSVISGLQQYVWLTEAPSALERMSLERLALVVCRQLENEYPDAGLIVEAEGTLPEVIANWDQMHMLFYQLLSNSIRFRKPGEPAYVNISSTSLMRNKFRNISEKYSYTSYVRLALADRGIGFDAEYRDQAFGLFKRLHATGGRGVGLALCKKIIENHHGEISIDSPEGQGAIVTILLPAAENEPEQAEQGNIKNPDLE
jgi:sigma-B regulation protein RsbU (phosphoserine phosphatase)